MAAQGRRAADPVGGPPADGLSDRLFREGPAFDFFQAVRLLQAIEPSRPRVGHGGPPQAEAVRFRALASLGFPASAIHDLSPPDGPGRPPEMVETFLGLTGPSGVLPRHYTELILRLDRDRRDPEAHALRDWLDLFNHRLVSLFYRAWEKYRPFLEMERGGPDRPEPDTFTTGLLSLIGLGTPALRGRLAVGLDGRAVADAVADADAAPGPSARIDDLALVYYGGLLSHRPRSAVGLRAILADHFRLDVEILQFRGRWLSLGPESQSRLAPGKARNRLGVDAVVGERAWDVQGMFRVRLGPLPYARFREFLPDRSPRPGLRSAFLLARLVRLYVGPEFDFDVQLVLSRDDVPACRLPVGDDEGPVLGWDAWVLGEPPGEDADDAAFADAQLLS